MYFFRRASGYDKIQCSYGWYRRWAGRFSVPIGYQDESDLLILAWVLEQYDNNELVTYEMLQAFAQRTLSQSKADFKASANWVNRFLKRHHILIHWEGHYKEALPPELESKAQNFLERTNTMDLGVNTNICCMDEIPLTFSANALEIPEEFVTPQDFEERVTRLRKMSIKHCEATIILALLRDGTLMPPMIIVKVRYIRNTGLEFRIVAQL